MGDLRTVDLTPPRELEEPSNHKTEDNEVEHGTEQEMIKREFSHHEKGVSRINNGSFGSSPLSVLASQRDYAMKFLSQPDKIYFGPLQEGILESRKIVAKIINAETIEEVSLVDNVTTAVATVLQQVAWCFMEEKYNQGDVIIMLHYAYGAVKKSIQAYAGRAGATIIEAELPFPVDSPCDIIDNFKATLAHAKGDGNRAIRMAVIDHVSSMPSVLLPLKELIKVCRDEGVDQVFVDGAHAIGNVDIDIQDLDVDFYTSNLHKWFFCPPSVAFLYTKKPLWSFLHHPVVSHEFGTGLPSECAWVGARDYSAQLCVPAALAFTMRFEGGIDGIKKRNHEKVVEMGIMLAEAWGTRLGTPPELCSSMIMVALPQIIKIGSDKDALDLRFRLREKFSVEVPIYYRAPDMDLGSDFRAYARISHQVYNIVDDYLRLRDAILQIAADVDQA